MPRETRKLLAKISRLICARRIMKTQNGRICFSADDNLHLNPADGSLKVNQAVIYDAYRDRLNPYFYAETDYYDPKTYETDYSVLKSISEEEAKRIEDAFPDNRVITWVPFAQYAGR